MSLSLTHPTKGLDLHFTFCPLCKQLAEELTVGAVLKYFTKDDTFLGYGHPGGVLAMALIENEVEYKTGPVRDAERLPGSKPCPNCEAYIAQQQAEFEREVQLGGVKWHCESCGKAGIIIHNDRAGFSVKMRAAAAVYPPEPLGIVFTRCNQHACEDDRGKYIN